MCAAHSDSAAISIEGLTKHFEVPVRAAGLRASLKAIGRRNMRTVRAVDDITFSIEPGEVVGFLGPNGAGKTTTLKMLSGLLHPTSGTAQVLGYEPFRRDRAFLRKISLVMGQRAQLLWDIPAIDSFEMLCTIYGLERSAYEQQRDELTELFELDGLLDKPVRQLSLGERMKCELAGGLLHRPEILYLDEPTLGLDVQAQRTVRDFVDRYARATRATVLLTSHYMADIEALAERVIVIHHGMLQFDGELRDLARRTSDRKVVTVRLAHESAATRDEAAARELLSPCGDVLDATGGECVIAVQRSEIRPALAYLLDREEVIDFTVEDEPIERVMERVFEAAAANTE
jgi:ABC-2 type transport system ATP-binding protein